MADNKFVVAIFESSDSAQVQKSVEALVKSGVDKQYISIISRVEDEEKIEDIETKKANKKALKWAEWGALSGGLLGLLIGGIVFTAPVTGPVATVGASLAGAINGLLGGAVAGSALFGVADGLVEWGMAAEGAKRLEKLVEEGHILLIVKTDEAQSKQVEETLKESGAKEIEIL
ncbi:hypothetical protein [Nitratifractor salsuginis]|uniref:General stress protein 17M-like domain-containing protein n=1 Tax=Nitratifractor salsuginis (strain DSM 16511 / JCM 12458 / E9I37-1) TaxID=749222 RepID=E6X158_NITSE|nr:hypothetical protein [Nitratifractor salsuginis]ADV45861.1 hypothetical protein Nitsa_0593 [Nitratifractor salsuginis DSM 16511]